MDYPDVFYAVLSLGALVFLCHFLADALRHLRIPCAMLAACVLLCAVVGICKWAGAGSGATLMGCLLAPKGLALAAITLMPLALSGMEKPLFVVFPGMVGLSILAPLPFFGWMRKIMGQLFPYHAQTEP